MAADLCVVKERYCVRKEVANKQIINGNKRIINTQSIQTANPRHDFRIV